jgi:hypothetical protein
MLLKRENVSPKANSLINAFNIGVASLRGLQPEGGTGYRMGDLGIILVPTASKPPLRPTQPPVPWVHRAFSSAVKRMEREAIHLHPSRTEIKNGALTELLYAFVAWCLPLPFKCLQPHDTSFEVAR